MHEPPLKTNIGDPPPLPPLRLVADTSLVALGSAPELTLSPGLCVCSLPIHIPFRRATQHNVSFAPGPTPDHPQGSEDRKAKDFTSAGEPVP